MAVSLMNARTREPVATSVELAVTRKSRRRGLLGRDRLEDSAALILEPCAACTPRSCASTSTSCS